jgi:hypothetical protein
MLSAMPKWIYSYRTHFMDKFYTVPKWTYVRELGFYYFQINLNEYAHFTFISLIKDSLKYSVIFVLYNK